MPLGDTAKDLDAMSAIVLSFPGIWTGVSGQHAAMFRRKARAQTICAETLDWRVAMRSTQLTEGELSLKSATCLLAIGPQTPSIHSQSNSRPAISKSELVSNPVGLSNETTCEVIYCGHCKRNTVGGQEAVSPIIIPPTPKLDASTIPM
jgi:hypothetical protein